MARALLPVAFLLGAIAGCTGHRGSPGHGVDVDGPIAYQLSSWRGSVTLDIDTDGTVTRSKTVGPTETFALDASTFDELRRAISDAEFSTLEPKYGCGGCVDEAVHTITVTLDDRPYTVEAEEADAPARLLPAIHSLFTISQMPLP